MTCLLDTHILLWWTSEPERLSRGQRRILDRVDAQHPVAVSDISLWEIAVLADRGRIPLDRPLREWLGPATAPPLVQRVGITPAIAAATVELPERFHRDPADRILVATARVHGWTLITSDRRLAAA